jgi:hypothetical protein
MRHVSLFTSVHDSLPRANARISHSDVRHPANVRFDKRSSCAAARIDRIGLIITFTDDPTFGKIMESGASGTVC